MPVICGTISMINGESIAVSHLSMPLILYRARSDKIAAGRMLRTRFSSHVRLLIAYGESLDIKLIIVLKRQVRRRQRSCFELESTFNTHLTRISIVLTA